MGKGRKLLRGKGKTMEQESHDLFEEQEEEDDDETQYSSFTPEEERTLVEFYRDNELLYNKKLSANRDKQKQRKVWEDQAMRMGKSVINLLKWIVRMRTRYVNLIYGKETGMATKQMTERDLWICSEFSFLLSHIGREMPTMTSKVDILFFSP